MYICVCACIYIYIYIYIYTYYVSFCSAAAVQRRLRLVQKVRSVASFRLGPPRNAAVGSLATWSLWAPRPAHVEFAEVCDPSVLTLRSINPQTYSANSLVFQARPVTQCSIVFQALKKEAAMDGARLGLGVRTFYGKRRQIANGLGTVRITNHTWDPSYRSWFAFLPLMSARTAV